ncbi:MAG: hypothetical protein KKD50_01605 [Proteobacteria bacterium]|nr:hypothetical protein [Pseudomonadota bacterium]
MYYVKTKREKVGRCNLCTKVKPLSWDHVPPKGGIELTAMEMENLVYVFTREKEVKRIRESQNGVKFRTICKECNEFIGVQYDTVINDFAISVGRYLKSQFKFPEVLHHKTKPVRLIRGILAHLVAAKVEFDDSLFDQQVRELIFDETEEIPNKTHIFYWIYPYDCTIILRDFGMPAVRGNFKAFGFFQTLKYFPMAYLISNKPYYENLLELTKYRKHGIDDEIEIPIQLSRVEHHYWPEMVDKGNMLFGGQAVTGSITALPKTAKSKKS